LELIMTGLDHRRADLGIREQFALTREKTAQVLKSIKEIDNIGGCVIISTCNRTELYASVSDNGTFEPTKTLLKALDSSCGFEYYFTEKTGETTIDHLCRVASGLDSQIIGDHQIITQVREALEFSREQNCTDSYIETLFKTAVKAAKIIKTTVILKLIGTDSIPNKAVEKIKRIYPLSSRNAVVIGNGHMGRLVSELLIRERVNVTVTLREYKKGIIQIPKSAETIRYSERYKAIERADIVISATTSPHYTLSYYDLNELTKLPDIFVDLAVPRDIEPSVKEISGITLLTIDDISGENRKLPQESIQRIEAIIREYVERYKRWKEFKSRSQKSGVMILTSDF